MFPRILVTLLWASLLHATGKPNVLLICIDDLRPELKSFGMDYIHSPNIDKLAASGRPFFNHYVQAPTCGASRFTLLTGRYGSSGNGALFGRSKSIQHASFPAWFRKHGYTTISLGKVSHHPGGRGGSEWDDDAVPEMPESWDRHLLPSGAWQHPRGVMHGLANGEIRRNAKNMDVYQAFEGPDSAYPDGLIIDEAIKQLDELSSNARAKPFFLTVGIIRPHLPFGAPARYMRPYLEVDLPPVAHPSKPVGRTTWHGSGEFMKYNRWKRNPNTDAEFAILCRKHYAACVTYADALVGRLVDRLDALGLRDDTLILLWGDHGWHLGEHAIWGKHALFEESLRSPLIISHTGMQNPGKPSRSTVETLDIFPTVCELAGLKTPSYLDGTSLVPILEDPDSPGHPAISYHGSARTIRTKQHRLIAHRNGHLELYDHATPEGETRNLADTRKDKAAELLKTLEVRLKR